MFAFRELARNDATMALAFERARQSRKRVTSVYDASVTCNLRCDGCLFFNRDGDYKGAEKLPSAGIYSHFFQEERARGVTYPIFGGAEPGAHQDILAEAGRVWKSGMVHTNGTIRFAKELPFRLYVSCWGHRENTNKWRGADCYDKVFKNISSDPRVLINYTVSHANIDDILPVVADAASHNVKITFQVYSPTRDYHDVLANNSKGTHVFAKESTLEDNLLMTREDDALANSIINTAIDEFPSTVVFTKNLATWLFARPGVFYDQIAGLDEIPQNCSVARDKSHVHYRSGLSIESNKTCGHPDILCKTCRTYTSIYTEYFRQKGLSINNTEDAKDYLLAHNVFHEIFYQH